MPSYLADESRDVTALLSRAVVLNRGASEPWGPQKAVGVPPISKFDRYLLVNCS